MYKFHSRRSIAAVSATCLVVGMLATTQPANADTSTGLLSWYPLNSTTTVTATAGQSALRSAAVNTANWQPTHVDLTGGYIADTTYGGYAGLTTSFAADFDVFINANATGSANSTLFTYGANSTSQTINVKPFQTSTTSAATIVTPSGSATASLPALTKGVWHNVAVSLDGHADTLTVFVDGKQAGQATGVTVDASALGAGVMRLNRESTTYTNVPSKYRDLRTYNRALSETDAAELSAANDEFAESQLLGTAVADGATVTADIALPTAGGTTWTSSNPAVISATGKVTRPANGAGDASVVLTPSFSRADAITVTVPQLPADSAMAQADADALTIPNADDVRTSLTLPTVGGVNGATITWASSDPAAVKVTTDATGTAAIVTRTAADQSVTLTATVVKNGATVTKDIKLVLPAKEVKGPLKSYLFASFTGTEGNADMEQMYFASSQDGDFWTDLNDKKPVLRSTVGEKGVRDPYLVRSQDGDKFFLFATDLSIYYRGGWGNAQATTTGSKSIVVWESDDLVNWSEPVLTEIAPGDFGMAWAPEAIWDPEQNMYMVYWASLSPIASNQVNIWRAYTHDFRTFTEPELYIDRPTHDIIDTDIIKVGDTYYRASGDGQLTIEKSTTGLSGNWTEISNLQTLGFGLTGGQVEGPEFFKYNDDDEDIVNGVSVDTWALLVDQYAAGKGYYPIKTYDIGDTTPVTNPASAWETVPADDYDFGMKKRHGTILAVTDAEYAALMAAYPNTPAPTPPAQETDPIVHYDLTKYQGTGPVTDISGHKNDGTFTGTFTEEDDAVTFSGDDFITIPDGLLTNWDEITVTTRVKSRTTGNHFIWSLGNTDATGTGNGYFFQNSNYRTAIASGNWGTETNIGATAIPQNAWVNLGVTIDKLDNGTYRMTAWQDGVAVGSIRTSTLPRDIAIRAAGNTAANFIGKSAYPADQLFKGAIADFRIYNRALSSSEMVDLGASSTAILGVTLDSLKVPAIVTNATRTVSLPVQPGTDLTKLAPVYSTVSSSVVSPTGVQDYSKPVTVTVTAADGSTQDWTVTAVEMKSPVLPGYNADPNVFEWQGTYYIYATSDGYAGWGGNTFYVWKSTDLVNWTKSDKPFLTLDGANGNVPWATGNAWAPTIIERDGKFYFYFSGHNPTYNRKTIGVAVADSPEGPFTAQPTAMITNGEAVTSGQAIDPAAFKDPVSGKYYLFWGNGSPLYAELNDDMVSINQSTIKKISGLTNFREGLFLNYRDGMYHLTYSIDDTGSVNYRVGYATSTSIDGPWTYRGIILEKDVTQGILGTGHSSILNIPGTDEWYIVYHRFGMPNGDGTHRETTIDKLVFGADGLIQKVVPTLTSVDALTATPEPSPTVTPSVEPSVSVSPSVEPSVSVTPTTEPSVSVTPTTEPTVSVTPTTEPSVSVTPTTEPSVSVTPTTEPSVSVSPTATVKPSTSASPTVKPSTSAAPIQGDVYSMPGFHLVNGRHWYTSCEPYSQTVRCRTDIWATRVVFSGGKFVTQSGWTFNNWTYLPLMTRAQWGSNPYAHTGEWTNNGYKWRTECDTAATGANACRSYIWTTYVKPTVTSAGTSYSLTQGWVVNNIVRFKA